MGGFPVSPEDAPSSPGWGLQRQGAGQGISSCGLLQACSPLACSVTSPTPCCSPKWLSNITDDSVSWAVLVLKSSRSQAPPVSVLRNGVPEVILLHTLLHFILPVSLMPGQRSFWPLVAEEIDRPCWVNGPGVGVMGHPANLSHPQNTFFAALRERGCLLLGEE